MEVKPNYYSVIPADVRYDKNLKANEKLLYGEITALSNQKGYCWAENNYFAKLFEVSKATVSRWVSNLEKNGYVRTELIYGKDKQVTERRIYMADPLLTKSSIPPIRNNQDPIDENVKEELNITRTNTTSINNDNDNAEVTGSESPQNKKTETQDQKTEELKPQNSKLVHQFYQENINAMETPHVSQELEYWIQDLSVELVLEALKRTVEYGGEFGYTKRIMKNWEKKGIDSMDKVEQADAAFEQKNQKKYNNRSKQSKREEKLPDWAKKDSETEETETKAKVADEPVADSNIQSRLEKLRRLKGMNTN